uniref:Uncharacterized protein n=1 Tax=Arundo donax TaxID=35708 RepID=A0A0A9DKM1_ARUDO
MQDNVHDNLFQHTVLGQFSNLITHLLSFTVTGMPVVAFCNSSAILLTHSKAEFSSISNACSSCSEVSLSIGLPLREDLMCFL